MAATTRASESDPVVHWIHIGVGADGARLPAVSLAYRCGVPFCTRNVEHKASGQCLSHYEMERRTRIATDGRACSQCERVTYARGMCEKHYRVVLRRRRRAQQNHLPRSFAAPLPSSPGSDTMSDGATSNTATEASYEGDQFCSSVDYMDIDTF